MRYTGRKGARKTSRDARRGPGHGEDRPDCGWEKLVCRDERSKRRRRGRCAERTGPKVRCSWKMHDQGLIRVSKVFAATGVATK